MKRPINILSLPLLLLALSCSRLNTQINVTPSQSDLEFDKLAATWDEAVPLGNAFVGALVWQRDSMLRFSLDRVDLWDLRKVENFNDSRFSFEWVKQQIRDKNYSIVQQLFDNPYNTEAFPSKIPGGAIELPLNNLGELVSSRLYLNNAVCEVVWSSGTTLKTFVDANNPVGWFVFDGFIGDFNPNLVTPKYGDDSEGGDDGSHSGPDLKRLGYVQGEIVSVDNLITYHQIGSEGFYYDIAVTWRQKGDKVVGVWSVTSSLDDSAVAAQQVAESFDEGIESSYANHMEFWDEYWSLSSVDLPNKTIQKQYDNEMYKFASVSRENSYPISLQAIWTADNGMLPPWKGDYHHDLNTQLSAWPAYIGNRLDVGYGFLHTLWNQRERNKEFTKEYFGVDGLNVPGVTTLVGEPMGGWIQYSLSQTTAAWLSQHFYLHWKYSADREFLQNRAYPYIKDVATYLEKATIVNSKGVRTLEFSSSPEINDNSINAWFTTITNYDLALIRFLFMAASELASELDLESESNHWKSLENQLPAFDVDSDGALTFAKGSEYSSSHRHFSHAMAFHPLGLLDYSKGEESQKIIDATLRKIDEHGSAWWTGYSFSWLANMKARVFDGDGAEQALETFANCFCLANTFHANGDQSKSGKSNFTYRPFTLEGNFAFASAVHEMLLQSHTSIVKLFPAIPSDWSDVSFKNLRAMGGFLISSKMSGSKVEYVEVLSEKGGTIKIENPFDSSKTVIELSLTAGERIVLKND